MKSLLGDTPLTPLSDKSINKQSSPLKIIHQNLYDRLSQESELIKNRKKELRKSYESIQFQECSFKPRISQKSMVLKSNDSQQPRYMSPRKVFQSEHIDPSSPIQYKQKVSNYKGRSIEKENKSIEKYSESMQKQKHFNQQNEIITTSNLTNKQNEKYVIHHFVREFYKALTLARCETLNDLKINYTLSFQFDIESDLCLITFREMCQILDTLGFVPQENRKLNLDIFEKLQCPIDFELILSRNLLCFLLCIQRYHQEMEQIPSYENQYKINFPPQYNNGLTQFISGNLRVYNPELLQNHFQILKVNYLTYKKSNDIIEENQTTFKTSKQTQVLANQYRQRVASEIQLQNVNLNDYDLIYQRKKNKLIYENDKITQQRCTFNPKINETKTNSKYLQPKTNHKQCQSQENIPQFKPNTKKANGKIVEIIPNNTDNAIERMIKGRVQRQLSQAIIEQGTCNKKKRQQLEDKILQSEKQKNSPLLFIDIILDNEKKERIAVKENDSAQKLAEKFISQNNINKSQQDRLTKLLEQQLQQI